MLSSPSQQPIALNIISGQLGSGKTTLLRQFLAQKPDDEHWALLVNEFGAVGIDGALLTDNAQSQTNVYQVPGGCICCTAQTELVSTITDLIQQQRPNRLLIEPTGLGEPESLVDVFTTGELAGQFDVQTLFSVFDVANTDLEEVKTMTILQSLLNMADIVVLNKSDLATPQQIAPLQTYCEQLYPAKKAVVTTQQAQLTLDSLTYSHFHQPKFKPMLDFSHAPVTSQHAHLSQAPTETTLPYDGIESPDLLNRVYQKQLDTRALGWVFSPDVIFNWSAVFDVLTQLKNGDFSDATPTTVRRAKGIFRVGGTSRMVFQLVHQEITRDFIAYRKDSRFEILIDADSPFQFEAFERALFNCLKQL